MKTRWEKVIKKTFVLKDGYVELSTVPGFGIELYEDAMADKIDHDWITPKTYNSDDNSVVV